MEPKKSPEADLEKKKGLFLQIGLVVSLAVTLVAFEWKSYDKVEYDLGQLKVEDVPEEIIPITKQEEKPPPPLKSHRKPLLKFNPSKKRLLMSLKFSLLLRKCHLSLVVKVSL